MNAVEIEEAISELARQPFDSEEFAFALLETFGNKATTIKRLQSGASNSSDMAGGVLQRNNIHIAVCRAGDVPQTLMAVNGGAKLVHPGGAKLVHLTLCGTRCWGVVPVVHRRDPRCFE